MIIDGVRWCCLHISIFIIGSRVQHPHSGWKLPSLTNGPHRTYVKLSFSFFTHDAYFSWAQLKSSLSVDYVSRVHPCQLIWVSGYKSNKALRLKSRLRQWHCKISFYIFLIIEALTEKSLLKLCQRWTASIQNARSDVDNKDTSIHQKGKNGLIPVRVITCRDWMLCFHHCYRPSITLQSTGESDNMTGPRPILPLCPHNFLSESCVKRLGPPIKSSRKCFFGQTAIQNSSAKASLNSAFSASEIKLWRSEPHCLWP